MNQSNLFSNTKKSSTDSKYVTRISVPPPDEDGCKTNQSSDLVYGLKVATNDSKNLKQKFSPPNFMHDPKTSIFYDQYSTLVTVDDDEYKSKSNIDINVKRQNDNIIITTLKPSSCDIDDSKTLNSDSNLKRHENASPIFVEIRKPSNNCSAQFLSVDAISLTESQDLTVLQLEQQQKRKVSLMPLLTEEDLISSNMGHKDPVSVAQVFGEDFASKFCTGPSYSAFSSSLAKSVKSLDKSFEDSMGRHSPLPYDSKEKMIRSEITPESTLLSFEMRDNNLPRYVLMLKTFNYYIKLFVRKPISK